MEEVLSNILDLHPHNVDSYNEIKTNEYDVYVSTLAGSLLPYQNLGTIILMNSENDNYFNDQSPRFDLKKVMIERGKLEGAKVLMHSLCPTIKEYVRGLGRSEDYYIMIDNRNNKEVANVEVIDLKEELKFGNNSYISLKLLKLLQINKAKNKKSILIVNNKGYSSYVMCRSCGDIIKCSRCKTTMQYNKKNEMLVENIDMAKDALMTNKFPCPILFFGESRRDFTVRAEGFDFIKDPSALPDEKAEIIGIDKVLENVNDSLTDKIPAFGVAVYTTLKD